MDRARAQESGIDLFDFIYEVWRGKWIVLAIVAVALIAGVASIGPRLISGEPVAAPIETAKVQFRLGDLNNDPAQRQSPQIISDFLTRLTEDGTLNLSNSESASIGIPLTPYTYRVGYSPGANIGVLTVTAPGAPRDYFTRLYAAMQKAAEGQLTDLTRQLSSDLETIRQIKQTTYTGDSDVLARNIYIATRFLGFPSVRDGSWRLVRLEAMETSSVAGASGGGGYSRRLLISLLAGLATAAVVIMFRIAIERRRLREAAA